MFSPPLSIFVFKKVILGPVLKLYAHECTMEVTKAASLEKMAEKSTNINEAPKTGNFAFYIMLRNQSNSQPFHLTFKPHLYCKYISLNKFRKSICLKSLFAFQLKMSITCTCLTFRLYFFSSLPHNYSICWSALLFPMTNYIWDTIPLFLRANKFLVFKSNLFSSSGSN